MKTSRRQDLWQPMKTNRTRVRKKDRNDCNGIAFGRCRKSAGRVETTWWLEPMQITTKVGNQVYPLWQRKCVYFNAFYKNDQENFDILIWQFDKKMISQIWNIKVYTNIFQNVLSQVWTMTRKEWQQKVYTKITFH